MGLTTQQMIKWIQKANETIQENKAYLSDLDQAIGDGDHGFNMARGFEETAKKLSEGSYNEPADVLKDCSMTLISKVGGASGPLYGTAFLKMALALKGKEEIDYRSLSEAITAAADGIKQRGKAAEQEKTMIDVWSPVAYYMETQNEMDTEGFLRTAKQAMDRTKDMKAAKGRASYLRERSIGHLDPGSVSSYYVLSTLAQIIDEEEVSL
ncbi:dihydroxyacetone kinase subunit DhaL [Bacillus testis]|uniref:dihydroxyacetone kinase subunit DhaL n=1 Tax=Bacillus testis TaxID=1622072 RepID=UPI00067EF85F|nr:dihydroxyacetone kinase subunit DhaL [Bacillus testis]